MTMDSTFPYREILPAPALRDTVECYWSIGPVGSDADEGTHPILPDGCVDVVFECGSGGGTAQLVGTMTRPIVVHAATGSTYFGIRFASGQASRFVGPAVRELVDGSVDLRRLLPDRAAAIADTLCEAENGAARASLLDRTLPDLARRGSAPDLRVALALNRLRATGFRESIDAASRRLGLSRQHLRRLFLRETGIGPKQLARILRMRELLQRLSIVEAEPDWAETAIDAGFHDQSHMIGEFRRLAGATPTSWFADRWRSHDVPRDGASKFHSSKTPRARGDMLASPDDGPPRRIVD